MVATTQEVDQAKVDEFAGKLVGFFNGASLAFMTSIGHQTGLFDKMAELPPSTSEEIARAAGLNERYVREWLGAMTVGRVVEYDPATGKYTLPPEHAASLTRAAGPGNLAAMSQFFPEIGKVESRVIESFKNGRGVKYEEYPRFVEVMREESAQVFDATLVDVTLELVPGLKRKLEQGIDVADVGCGAGHAINVMAKAFPKSRFVGFDFSKDAIEFGRREASEWGLTNAQFEQRDAAQLGIKEKFDLVFVNDAVHDQARPADMLKGIYDALRPGGTFLCADIAASSKLEENLDHPLAPFLYWISTMHCMTVSMAYGGVGLGTVWGEQKACEMLAEAGFRDVEVKQVEGDILNNYYIAQKR